jgi:hypothetical protein
MNEHMPPGESLIMEWELSTPERWDYHQESSGHAVVVDCQDVTICRVYQQPRDTWMALDNAAFIATAHNVLPKLARSDTLLRELVQALDSAYISSWQTTAGWQKQLDEAKAHINGLLT